MTMFAAGGQGDPDEIVNIIEGPNTNDMYGDHFPDDKSGKVGKAGKKGKNANAQTQKAKAPLKPIESQYEGWTVTLFDKPMNEHASWIKTKRTKLPFDSKELYAKAINHHRETGIGGMGHYSSLNKNQQAIVDRLSAEFNQAEKAANAEWVLFDVKRLHVNIPARFKMLRVNHAMRVTFKRQDRTSGAVKPAIPLVYDQGDDVIDLSKPPKTAKPAKEGKEGKTGNKKGGKKMPQNDPLNMGPFVDALPPEMPINVGGGDPFAQNDTYGQPHHPPHHQQQQPDPFFDNQPQHPPPGAIPIPIPQQFQDQGHPIPPFAPDVPLHGGEHANPFAPERHVFPQPHELPPDLDDRRPRDPSVHRHQTPISARRPSQSRQRSEDDYHRQRRQSAERAESEERLRRLDTIDQKIDALHDTMNIAAANNKVRDWPVQSPYTSRSSGSSHRDDLWSHSSGERRYSTPGTSPEREYRHYQARRSSPFHRERRNSSGARPQHPESGRRYYPDQDRILQPHATYRDRKRGRYHDDYPTPTPRELRYPDPQRPRPQRRVTDYPEGLRHADFGGRQGRGVDYTRMNDRDDRRGGGYYEERRGGRARYPAYNH